MSRGRIFDISPYLHKKFGRLLVTGYEHRPKANRGSRHMLVCLCECGAQKVVNPGSLRDGITKSCGCLYKEGNVGTKTKHANCTRDIEQTPCNRTSIYRAWAKIIGICKLGKERNVNKVCHEFDPRWVDFEQFLNDFRQISANQTISRVNNKLPWSKENCFINIGRADSYR